MLSSPSLLHPLNVQIVLFDGFDLLDALAPYETFLAASAECPGLIQVTLVAADGPRHVPCGVGGLKIHAQRALTPTQADIVIVPGAAGSVDGDGPDSVPVLLDNAVNSPLAPLMTQAMAQEDLIVATVCGGSLILAMAGLIPGRCAVTHHLGMGLLEAAGVKPIHARVVEDGNLVTSGGVTSGLDISLYLLERVLGPQIAHSVETLFEYERRGTVWKDMGTAPASGKRTNSGEFESSASAHASPDAPDTDATPTTNEGVPNTVRPGQADGIWDVQIFSPIGVQKIIMTIEDEAGQVRGTAVQDGERSAFLDPKWIGDELSWEQHVTRPMKLKLKFKVQVSGDTMKGSAKAGMLVSVKLVGTRRSAATGNA